MNTAELERQVAYERNLETIPYRTWLHPLSVCEASGSDTENWITYPVHFPHLVRFADEGGSDLFGIRMRDASGQLRLLSEPNESETEARRELVAYWNDIESASRSQPDYVYRERLEEIMEPLRELQIDHLARPADPSWPSPFAVLDPEAMSRQELARLPKECPIILGLRLPDGSDAFAIERCVLLYKGPGRDLPGRYGGAVEKIEKTFAIVTGMSVRLALDDDPRIGWRQVRFNAFRKSNGVNLARSSFEGLLGGNDPSPDYAPAPRFF